MTVKIIGAGIAGLTTALALSERGIACEIFEKSEKFAQNCCSWFAGGMLAPWCERESAEEEVVTKGQIALEFWPRYVETSQHGTLVVAPLRDTRELDRFSRRTDHYRWVQEEEIAQLEPDLAGRFRRGLFFEQEAHLDPRMALNSLYALLKDRGIGFHFGVDGYKDRRDDEKIIDCRGFSARKSLENLRGVRGEMLILRTKEVKLSRPIRLLHPRIPLYIVPRADNLFMVGATMIENSDPRAMTVRSAIELLNSAYVIHPAFGEAEIVEFCADIRPALPDNLPKLYQRANILYFNGLYRHGFLLSPALAQEAALRLIEQ